MIKVAESFLSERCFFFFGRVYKTEKMFFNSLAEIEFS